jgi:tripartite-type tricarboxylate transporter receptor subunit TctC
LYAKPPYDAINDFAPIANLVSTPQTLVASPTAEFKTLQEFVAAARAKPGQINFASLGSGSTNHLSMEMFRSAARIQLNHVPFKTSADMYIQLLGGQVAVMSDVLPAALMHVKSGRLRGLGVAKLTRSPFLPELPTIAELGYPGFEAVGWVGIVAPARTPAAILDKLNAEMVSIISDPDIRERLNTLAFTRSAAAAQNSPLTSNRKSSSGVKRSGTLAQQPTEPPLHFRIVAEARHQQY